MEDLEEPPEMASGRRAHPTNVKRTPEHETRLQPPGIIKRRGTCVSKPWWRLGQEGNHMIGREKPWGTRK